MTDYATGGLITDPLPWTPGEHDYRVLFAANGKAALAITGPMSRGELGRELSRMIADHVNEKYADPIGPEECFVSSRDTDRGVFRCSRGSHDGRACSWTCPCHASHTRQPASEQLALI